MSSRAIALRTCKKNVRRLRYVSRRRRLMKATNSTTIVAITARTPSDGYAIPLLGADVDEPVVAVVVGVVVEVVV